MPDSDIAAHEMAEVRIIGQMLSCPEQFPEFQSRLGASPEVFTDPADRLIYAAALELSGNGVEPDAVAIATQIKANGQERRGSGLMARLKSVTETYGGFDPMSPENMDHYAGVVWESFVSRGMKLLGADLAGMAAEGRPMEYMQGHAQEALAKLSAPVSAKASDIGTLMVDVFAEIENPSDEGKTRLKPKALAEKIPFLHPGDMMVVAGTTSVGKSALAMNIAWQTCAPQKLPVVYITLEMTEAQMGQRVLSMLSGVGMGKITDPATMREQDHKRISSVAHLVEDVPFHVIYESGMGIDEAANIARMYHKKYGSLGCVVIDYLQYMRADTSDSRNEEVSKYSVRMKSLAGELRTACICVSQLNRQASGGAPELSHLRDSGSIEQDADVVVMIDKPSRDVEGAVDRDSLVFVRKNRQGETGEVEMRFTPSQMRWE